MEDAPVSPTTESLLQARRSFQERIPIVAMAYSLDGRSFLFQAPISANLGAGAFVRLDLGDGTTLLGQVLQVETEQVDGAEIRVQEAQDIGANLGGVSIGDTTVRVRRYGLRGSGTILNTLNPATSWTLAAFEDAGITQATTDDVGPRFSLWNQRRPTIDVGSLKVAGGDFPARIDASGFNRHTFLCGQSGSGKTYSLGVVLEQLLLSTDLRVLIVDPNADYVRLPELRPEVVQASEPNVSSRAATYADRLQHMRIHRNQPDLARHLPLRIRFSDLSADDQARTLRLDPLADREEFRAVTSLISHFGSDSFSLDDLQRKLAGDLSPSAHQLRLRLANLGIGNWSVWAEGDEPSLADTLGTDWRSMVLDISGFAQAQERAVVALAVLRNLWESRTSRKPVMIVIDEAHNVCPAVPENSIQAAAKDLMVTIAGEGRKYGLYLLLATQRPDKVHPNVISQCDNLMLMRMNSQADIDELGRVFSFIPAGMLGRASTFRQGEALLAGKVVPSPTFVQMGSRLSIEGGADVPTTWTTVSE